MVEVPLYGKIEGVLASEIAQGDLQPGDRLPSEDELLARFDVSRITVRRAIQNLIQRGLLEIRRGLGTFVLAPKISQELTKLTGFVEDMDIKVAQDLLRHANSRTTLDIYTHAVSQQKRDANTKVVELLLPGRALKAQHLSAPSPL